ncbi:hypothetical protein FPZ54_13100 [Sphingomonas suaedae]|uniref:MarR family transcriptional regulator n=1 Tax=Sphingomonas suaedae TaxID=2599297 RepID=A0A518RHD9_9SPHN|nr:hypothetical protein [Sphingomonas suaedae]QDX26851.1 hypothetical protein FPZ54_13100 [Sphingomonas suaedae]
MTDAVEVLASSLLFPSPEPTPAPVDAARALIVAPLDTIPRHEAALSGSGARMLGMIAPDQLAAKLDALIAAELILFDATGLSPEATADGAARIAAWSMDRSCRVVALLDAKALDAAAATLMDAGAVLLCEPSPGDYAAALSIAIGGAPARLHDAAREREAERLRLLNEEVARLAAVLSELAAEPGRNAVRDPGRQYRSGSVSDPHPDPRIVRAAIRARRLRDQHFSAELFADPAWDMLLDLYAARLEGRRVSVSSLCIAAAVPPTTALRWIGTMHEGALFEREPDARDRRRAHITLTARAADAMRGYFAAASRMGLAPA